MSNPNPSGDKKIFIDEDWKSQVEREKKEEEVGSSAEGEGEPQSMPANLTFIASNLFYQGLLGLGLVPNPMNEQASINLPLAHHAIQLLEVLQEKTNGNRTPEESNDLESMLHELRMAFVAIQQQLGSMPKDS